MSDRQILPPDHPDAPRYWMYETSGRLWPVVEAYLEGRFLSPGQVGLMRDYLQQWFRSPVWADCPQLAGLRLQIDAIRTREDIDTCIHIAHALEIDPL